MSSTPHAKVGWAMWFVGLPGSGKSSVARAVHQALSDQGRDVVHLEMDARRKVYFPNPSYSAEERARAYDLFVREAADMAAAGRGVIMDGSAHRLAMRRAARERIPKFAEIFLRCPLDVAMARERGRPEGMVMAGLYEKALHRKATGKHYPGLGQVIGVDVAFEEDPAAECVIQSDRLDVSQAREAVLGFCRSWLPGA